MIACSNKVPEIILRICVGSGLYIPDEFLKLQV